MRGRRLDRRITIQRKTLQQSPSGQATEVWADLARRWAYVEPAKGDERFTDPQYAAKEQTEFGIRWTRDLAALSPLDRIVYPVFPETSPPPAIPGSSIYDIIAVTEIGRREGLRILAMRRADA